ncbi:MAG TPA: YfiR family protein [Ignavibacteriales bacterium]|nr:YfiR family protein [Ignavibacteriales bacterium]
MLRIILNKFVILFLFANLSASPLQTFDEAEIKAAIFQKILYYINWPPSAFEQQNNFVIGIAGNDLVSKLLLQNLNNTVINGYKVIVKPVDNHDNLANYHVIYLTNLNKNIAKKIAITASYHPVLLVANEMQTYDLNFHIILYTLENKVKFKVNPDAAKSVNLVISSKIIQLSRKFEEN